MPNQSIYRPHFSTRFINFIQSRKLAIIGFIFLFTALKWGAFLSPFRQY